MPPAPSSTSSMPESNSSLADHGERRGTGDHQRVAFDASHRAPAWVLPDPSIGHLLIPKWLTARARTKSAERGHNLRMLLLAAFCLGFWSFIFVIVFRMLRM